MISRARVAFSGCRRWVPGGVLLAVCAGLLLLNGCQKVPLLAPSSSTIALSTPVTVLPVNGSTEITATVTSSAGQAVHDGTTVTFNTDLGSFEPGASAQTKAGTATVTFVAGSQSGTASITATSGANTSVPSGGTALQIKVGGAAAAAVALNANPPTVPASGGSSTITAIVLDASGNRLPGVPVNFTTTAGTLSASTVTTDASGEAQTTLTTKASSTVSATAGAVGIGTTTAPTVTVGVTSSAPINITLGTPSGTAVGPNLTVPPYAVDRPVNFTATVSANGSVSAPAIDHYAWDFGDGTTTTTTSAAASHIYTSGSPSGGYTITVTAYGVDGTTGTAQVVVQVE
jgi:adhesin/invasin